MANLEEGRGHPQKGECPLIPTALLEYLEEKYRPYVPTVGVPIEKVWVEAGKQHFLQLLRTTHDQQRTS